MIFEVLIGLAIFAVFCLVIYIVQREVRTLRAAKDQPATLEGGGSHLTVRKGK